MKYCGGCCPRYDRLALFEQIRHALHGRIEWVHHLDDAAETILVIGGCETDCADVGNLKGKQLIRLSDERALQTVIDHLLALK